jgi:hypothetical protein
MKFGQIISTAVIACAASGLLLAQTPPPQQQTQSTKHAADGQTVTAKGCLKAEKDVPGREPNMAERAGMNEDYILTNAKLTGAAADSMPSQPASATASAASTLWKNAFKVEGLDDSELKKHLNHQVEVTGTLKMAKTMTGATEEKTDKHLREIHATSLKMVSAQCTGATEQ